MRANDPDRRDQIEELREPQRAISGVLRAVDEAVETAPVGDLDLYGFGSAIPAYEVRGLKALHGS